MVAEDGESNWLEGLMLLAVYVILALAFFFLPERTASRSPAGLPPEAHTGLDRLRSSLRTLACDRI